MFLLVPPQAKTLFSFSSWFRFWFLICDTFYPEEIPASEVELIEGLLGFAVLTIPDVFLALR